jgi:pimeloyl-ACP methyl ester carboxylesterase
VTGQPFQEGWVTIPVVRAMRETVYGVKTHYVHAGDGEPIVLLHGGGAGGSGEHGWYNAIPVLAQHFHVYALDQLGYGYTDKPLIEYSFQAMVDHVAGFIDALNLGQVRLVGNSQGAYIAMKYACDFPERVKQIVTISTATLATAMGIKVVTSPPRYEGTKESIREFLLAILNDPAKVTDELVERRYQLTRLPGANEAKMSIQRYRALLEEDPHQREVFNVRHRVPELRIPWCVIWGADDRTAPIALGDELRKLAPNITEFHVVQGAGHQVQNDQPEVCNKLILNFFSSAVREPAAV